MARLYSDENFPRQVVEALRALGHDVLTALEACNAGQAISDEQVLAFGREHGRAVLTLNRRDFIRLRSCQPQHSGIVVCTQDPDTDRQARRIHDAITSIDSPSGQLVRVNRPPQ